MENIQEGRENQFEKCKNCDNQALKYDVGSVMHYSQYAFSKNRTAGLKTIIVKGDKTAKLGQRNGFSSLDIIGLNKLYCPGYKAKCRDNDPNCTSMIDVNHRTYLLSIVLEINFHTQNLFSHKIYPII